MGAFGGEECKGQRVVEVEDEMRMSLTEAENVLWGQHKVTSTFF
jgi:hypothetical protein